MADASITSTTAANFIPQVWSDGVVEAAEFASVVQKRINRSFDKDLTVGSTLNVPRLSNLTIQSKSSGVGSTIAFEAITEGVQQLTVARHEYAAFLIESVVQVQANQDLRSRYEKKIGYAISRGREAWLTGLNSSSNTVSFSDFSTNVIGTYGTELTSDDYLSAWQKLAEAGLLEMSVDPGEDFSLFLSPAAYAALMKVDVFTNKLYNGDSANAIQKASVGDIYGVPVFMSNLLYSPSAGQHDCAMIHRESMAMVVQEEIPVQSQFLIRNLADGVVGWNLYGSTIVSFPPETAGGGSAVDNRGVLLKTV